MNPEHGIEVGQRYRYGQSEVITIVASTSDGRWITRSNRKAQDRIEPAEHLIGDISDGRLTLITVPAVPEGVFPRWCNVRAGSTAPVYAAPTAASFHRSREVADAVAFGTPRLAVIRIDGWDDDGNLLGQVEQP